MNGRDASSNLVLVYQIIKHERCSVYYLDGSGRIERLLSIHPKCLSRESDQKRAAAFPAGLEHILDYLVGLVPVEVRLQGLVDLLFNRTPPTLESIWKIPHLALCPGGMFR